MLTTDSHKDSERHMILQMDHESIKVLEDAIFEIKEKLQILEVGE